MNMRRSDLLRLSSMQKEGEETYGMGHAGTEIPYSTTYGSRENIRFGIRGI